jgi:hypothetical protein
MNYNAWFNKYHQYLTGVRNGTRTFNDTKWKTINDRYSKLIDLMSPLLDEQPYNVIGNYTGFEQYFDLMTRSNYTFEDVDRSLIETYKATLQNAMGNMMVNTHVILAKYSFNDKKHVSHDKYEHYYIIDVPFAQLHFGERDEFVRQKLHAFYETESQYFMPADRFLSEEMSKILGFTIICCTNGFMSDDWYVGISEQGFRFKIGWRYSADVEFMIMKLDESFVYDVEVDTSKVRSDYELTYDELGLDPGYVKGKNCILQISDSVVRKSVVIAPNFGYFTETGLKCPNLQAKTYQDFTNYKSSKAKIRIYVIKYLREVPGIFPAVNYYDMMSSKYVYTENYDNVTNSDGSRIVLQDQHVDTILPICTPPISLSRISQDDNRHDVIKKCFEVTFDMESVRLAIKALGNNVNTRTPTIKRGQTLRDWYRSNVLDLSRSIYNTLYAAYMHYAAGAMMTALIPLDLISLFRTEVGKFDTLAMCDPDYIDIQTHSFDLLYGDNYEQFMKKICEPLNKPPFSTFGQVQYPDYFPQTPVCVNRPVSEQCLIPLKYNTNEGYGCWVFDLPNVKHFHGIDNIFYIDSELTGDELFKFMYLYTDTENPTEPNMVNMRDEQLLDFDLFTKEVDKHMGFIRYWDVSNRLMKLCHMFYREHDQITELAIITKIMKHKLDGDIFLEYASDVNYELSNVTSDNIKDYTETSSRAPFTINFLFYTLSLFYGHQNRMQSFLLHAITQKEFYPRYADLRISDMDIDLLSEDINYSVISWTPTATISPDVEYASLPDTSDLKIFNGLQFPLNPSTFVPLDPSGNIVRYPFVFNVYRSMSPFYMLTSEGIDKTHYIEYSNVTGCMGTVPMTTYYDDAQLASLITIFLAEIYDGISDLTTNYKSCWNSQPIINSMKETVRKRTADIQAYVTGRGSALMCHASGASAVIEQFMQSYRSNPVYVKLDELESNLKFAKGPLTNNRYITDIFDNAQKLITIIRKIHESSGFDRFAIRNVRRLYIQLKQIEHNMSLYQYKQWLTDVDMTTVDHLQDYLADNPNNPYKDTEIAIAIRNFKASHLIATTRINLIQPIIDDFLSNVQTPYIDMLVTFCDDVIQNYIFDFYVMNKIPFTNQFTGEAAYAEIQISSDDPHVAWDINPITDKTYAMLAQVKCDVSNGISYITEIIPTCENAFVSGEDATVSIAIYNALGDQIQLFNDITATFTKIGSSADIKQNARRYMNGQSIPLETQNVHETFDADGSDIIQKRHAELHYELLAGNRFTPLEHTSEYCTPYLFEIQGPVDKIYLSCEQMNRLAIADEANRPTQTMHFRACDVYHIEPVNGVITSIGGKYFEGQTLYAVTDDGLSLFPIVIQSIDHSLERGFIEAKVDLQHTKWFETNDPEVMHKYLTTDIECAVIDDNIRNFLDEFSDYDGNVYIIPELRKKNDGTMVELPGDPIFVQSNSEYVYTRLAWMFHDEIPNRFHVDTDVRHHFVYIGSGEVVTADREIYVNMVNHNFNPYTLPELYEILRSEPDDHLVWNEERKVFAQEASKGVTHVSEYSAHIMYLYRAMSAATTEQRRQEIRLEIEDSELKLKYWQDYTNRMDEYLKQLESPTTWYNVRAYDDALVYINNGRAKLAKTFIPHIQDIPYSDQLQVLLYDWDAKEWINPVMYSIETLMEDDISLDPVCESNTDNVLTTMCITFADESFKSRRILIYFAYETSDVFDNIPLNEMECTVRFQPVLTVYREHIGDDKKNIYDTIRIRKHYDENETYYSGDMKPLPESFGAMNGFIFERPDRSGKYTTGSPIRYGDMILHTGNLEYTFEDFDIYIEDPLKNNSIEQSKTEVSYSVSGIHPADNYEAGHIVTLIAVNNDENTSFGVSASSVMFTGLTTDSGIVIQNSTIPNYADHSYTCTIIPNPSHPMNGGVYTITVSSQINSETDVGDWIHLDTPDLAYKLIAKRVALIPHQNVTLTGESYITLSNHYVKDTTHEVEPDNAGHDDLYTYYYDKEHDVRYPVGDVLTNSCRDRFTLDLTSNPNVESIRSNFLGICRYATQKIPSDGVIDLTGLIPTPLSRDRYEFWVNGRYVSDPDQIIILSPTTFQLRNMTSLKNLDVVELVDDVAPNMINRLGPTYVDLDGNTYCSYLEILRKRADIVDQSIAFMFNQDVHSDFDTYLYDKIRDGNNHDYETDIMSLITNPIITSYNQLHNIPTINGTSIFNLRTADIGFQEIPNREILHTFDKVWKLEGLNGVTPFKHMSAYVDSIGDEQRLHVEKVEGGFEVYASGLSDGCFTLYISTSKYGDIDDISRTLQIIPMLRPGTHVLIDERFAGEWLHSTVPNTEAIKIE